MKRYRYPTDKQPFSFEAALSYLKMTKEFDGTPEDFFGAQDIWNTIPINLDMYFMYRPYLEIMGLQDQLDGEIKRIIGKDANRWYKCNDKYGYYLNEPGSNGNIIQISCPQRSEDDGALIPYDEWETNGDAIKWLSHYVIEEISETEIEMVPPVDGVMVE